MKLAQIFGIRVGVSRSWFIVLFVVIYLLRGYFNAILGLSGEAFAVAVASALLFFASLVLHELGHALVARRLGMQIDGIDLWALGGFTRTRGDAETARAEFEMAAAGPLVTALVVAACVLVGLAFGSFRHFLDVALLRSGVHVTAPLALLSWLALINAFLFVFNLLPAFPLDGGRIARALFWALSGNRDAATRACAVIGQGFGWLVIFAGVALAASGSVGLGAGLWLVLIGLFLSQAARGALAQSAFSERIRRVQITDIMDSAPVTIDEHTSLLDAHESFFLRYRWPWFAVTGADGRYVGVLRAGRVEEELAAGRPALTAGSACDAEKPWRIDSGGSLEALLSSDGLRRMGAVVAIDADGVLRGVVTLAAVRRALGAPSGV